MSMIHPTADVESGAEIGAGTAIWSWTHIRASARVGTDCLIGAGVYVDSDVVIGSRVKIGNKAQLFLLSRIGDDVFIGPGACLTNDRFPRAVTADGNPKTSTDWVARGVEVGDGASVGAMATVLPGVAIGPSAMVGAGSVVTRAVDSHALVVGNPARRVGWVCRCGHPLNAALACDCGREYRAVSAGVAEIAD